MKVPFILVAVLQTVLTFSSTEALANDEKEPVNSSYNLKTVERVDQLVKRNFYAPAKLTRWSQTMSELREKALAAKDKRTLSLAINEALSTLKSSHCQYLTTNDEAFYFLNSLFRTKNPASKPLPLVGIVTGGYFPPDKVRYILSGSPAAKAGIEIGDRIISVNGTPYKDFSDLLKASPLAIAFERDGKKNEVVVIPKIDEIYPFYVKAMRASVKTYNRGKLKLGYVHVFAGGPINHEELDDILTSMEELDGLVLDLRDGYGASDLSDLDPFFRPKAAYPDLSAINSVGIEIKNRMVFDKPLVALINRGTRSGKELLAFGLKRSKRALLVGENTAGYLLAGKLFPIDKDSALYLAVSDVKLDGEKLEGLGIAPDLPVLNEKADQTGHDMQLKAALDALEKQIQSR